MRRIQEFLLCDHIKAEVNSTSSLKGPTKHSTIALHINDTYLIYRIRDSVQAQCLNLRGQRAEARRGSHDREAKLAHAKPETNKKFNIKNTRLILN